MPLALIPRALTTLLAILPILLGIVLHVKVSLLFSGNVRIFKCYHGARRVGNTNIC